VSCSEAILNEDHRARLNKTLQVGLDMGTRANRTSPAPLGNENLKDALLTDSVPSHDQVRPASMLKAGPRAAMGFPSVNSNVSVRPAAPRTRKYQ
jgi:hypothetical protein